jgi:hypothetical protein
VSLAGALRPLGVAGPPRLVRRALGRRREGIVVLRPTGSPGPADPAARTRTPTGTTLSAGPAVPAGTTRPPMPTGTPVSALPGTRTTALTGACLRPRSRLRRRRRALSQQRQAALASPGRSRRERAESQAAIGHEKSVFP